MRATYFRVRRRGAALIAALTLLTIVLLSTGMLLRQVGAQQRSTRDAARKLQAQFLVESAVERGVVELKNDRSYHGERWQPVLESKDAQASVVIEVKPAAEEGLFHLTVTADYADHPARQAKATATRVIRLPAAN